MTREEAIKWFKNRLESGLMPGAEKAFNTAIEALKQPEIIYCKDCKYSSDESFCSLYYSDKPYEEDFYCSYAERKMIDGYILL